MTRLLESLVFGRPLRVLAVLIPLGLLGWLCVYAAGGWLAVVAIAVPGLAGLVALFGWVMGAWRPR